MSSNFERHAETITAEDLSLPVIRARVRTTERKFWPKLLKHLARIPFADDLATAYYCAIDKKTPTRVRGVMLFALVYFITPTDLVPDFIAALGFTDDASVAMAAFGLVGSHVKPRHRRLARERLGLPPEADEDD